MTYAIHHYPTQLIDVWWSRRGERVTVRPILPQDAEPSQQFVRSLSQRSRYRRFHGALNELTPAMLERLTQVDYRRHLALVAETVADGAPVLIGEARYASDGALRSGEFALAVADRWQGQGVGTLLLGNLLRAAAEGGLRHLYGNVLHDNQPMLALAQRMGFICHPHGADEALMQVAIDPLTATAAGSAPRTAPRPAWTDRLAGRLPLAFLAGRTRHGAGRHSPL